LALGFLRMLLLRKDLVCLHVLGPDGAGCQAKQAAPGGGLAVGFLRTLLFRKGLVVLRVLDRGGEGG